MNYALVGAFVLVLSAALIAGALWLASGGAFQKKYDLYLAIEEESVAGIGRGTPFTTAAFALAKGTLSEPVKIPRGWGLLWLDEEREPRIPELAEVSTRVRQAALQERQIELARQALTRARGELGAGKSIEAVASGLGVQRVQGQA